MDKPVAAATNPIGLAVWDPLCGTHSVERARQQMVGLAWDVASVVD